MACMGYARVSTVYQDLDAQLMRLGVLANEDALTHTIIALASENGGYGYRRVAALLQAVGWQVGKDQVQRIRGHEGLKVPLKRRHLWRTMAYGCGCGCCINGYHHTVASQSARYKIPIWSCGGHR